MRKNEQKKKCIFYLFIVFVYKLFIMERESKYVCLLIQREGDRQLDRKREIDRRIDSQIDK